MEGPTALPHAVDAKYQLQHTLSQHLPRRGHRLFKLSIGKEKLLLELLELHLEHVALLFRRVPVELQGLDGGGVDALRLVEGGLALEDVRVEEALQQLVGLLINY